MTNSLQGYVHLTLDLYSDLSFFLSTAYFKDCSSYHVEILKMQYSSKSSMSYGFEFTAVTEKEFGKLQLNMFLCAMIFKMVFS